MPSPPVRALRTRNPWRVGLLVLCLLLTLLAVPFLADYAPPVGLVGGVEKAGEASQCVAFGTNWTSCANAFTSNDTYAYANETGVPTSLLIDITSTSSASAPATWADIPDLGATVTVAGPGSVLILAFAQQQTLTADDTAEYRFAIDGTRDGPQLAQFNDATDEGMGLSMMFAVTGLSAGSHAFSVQWQIVAGTPLADTSRTRSFQVLEIESGANILTDVVSTTSGTAPSSWADVPDLTGSPTVVGPNSVVLLLAGVQQAMSGDDSADYQFSVDGTREGAQLTQFNDATDEGTGLSIAYARTGLVAGSHTFSLQWQNRLGTTTSVDTGRPRTFQVVEITSANLLVDVGSTSSGTAPGGWADVPNLTGSASPASPDSLSLLLANIQIAALDGTDRSVDFRLAVDGTREGGQIVSFQDTTDGVGSTMLPWFRTGLSGTHTFSAQWQNLQSFPTLDTSRNRTFQVLEFPGTASDTDTAWRDFGFALGSDTISSVEVGVEWFRNNTAPVMNVTVSWDGGTSWAPDQTATNKSADDDTVEFLDFTSATAWTGAKLDDANLRVRIGTNATGARLDYLTVRVNYNAAPRVSDFRLEDGSGMSRAGDQLEVSTQYHFLFNVSDEDGWSDIGTDGSVSLRLWYDGNVTLELPYGAQTNGSSFRIELRYEDALDPGNASVDEWRVVEGDASYSAVASSASAILNGSLVVGFAFGLAFTLGNQIGGSSDPTNTTPGAYNDPDSWNADIVTTDGVAVVTHPTAATGEHMEFGVQVPAISPVLRLDRTEAEHGDVVLAILYFNNTGSGRALRAWANWSLDGHYELMDIFPAQTITFSAEGFDIWLTDVDPGAHSLVARLRVIRGLEDGLAMQVRITWDVTDGNGNPLPGAEDTGVVTLLAPILAVDLRASDTSVQVGSEFILDITVENKGRADGSGWLNMTLPPGAAFVSHNGTLEVTTTAGLVSWRIASLAPTDQVRVQVRLRVNDGPSLESFVLSVDFTDGAGSPPLTVFSNQVFVRFLGSGTIPLPWWIFLLPLLIPVVFGAYYANRRLRHPELRIEEVFVIHRKGILVAHQSRTLTPDKDRDVLAAMFKAVQGFVQEAFARGTEGSMRGLRFENFSILIEQGTYHYVAVVYQGQESRILARRVVTLSQSIEAEFGALLAAWVGDMNEVRGIRYLLPLIWGESAAFGPREAPRPAVRAPSPLAPTPRVEYRSIPGKPVWRLAIPVGSAHRLLRSTSLLMRDLIESKEKVLRRITAIARAAIRMAIGFVRGTSKRRLAPYGS